MKRILLTLCAILAFSSVPATAAPITQFEDGRTTVALSQEFLAAITALRLETRAVRPASLRSGQLRVPVTSGAVDNANIRGEVFHSGGLALRAGTVTVILYDLIIDTVGTPKITGMAAVNDSVVGRLPLFNLTLPTLALPISFPNGLKFKDLPVTLTSEGATALNGAFGVTSFSTGLKIGSASVVSETRSVGIRLR